MAGFLPSLETFAKGTLATAATLTTVGAGLLYYGQNYLIYPSAFPSGSRTGVIPFSPLSSAVVAATRTEDVPVPASFNLPYQDLELKTSDGITLRCYLLPQSKRLPRLHPSSTVIPGEDDMTEDELIMSRPTVIMFHGNGGNHGHRVPLARVFLLRMRCNVLMMSYRGYGRSEGSPSEPGLQIDAQTALDYLLSDPCFSKTRIILYGQSIGGAVSIDLASRNPSKIYALILENTFTSLPNVVPYALPLLGPLSFLVHQKWDSASKIHMIPASTPVLMLSGLNDELVPKEHMKDLWEAIVKRGEGATGDGKGERAKFVEFPLGMHNDTCVQPGYWTAVSDFVAGLAAEVDDHEEKPPQTRL